MANVTNADRPRIIHELWWMGVVIGLLTVFFGITALFWPGLTLIALVYLFSGFILAVGLLEIIHGLMSIHRRNTWWLTVLIGAIGLAVGVYLIRHPGVSLATFITIVGVALIARGLVEAVRAFTGKGHGSHRVLEVLIGIAAVVAGIVILLQPVSGGVAFVWILGLYALLSGAFTLAVAFEARAAFERMLGVGTEEGANTSRKEIGR